MYACALILCLTVLARLFAPGVLWLALACMQTRSISIDSLMHVHLLTHTSSYGVLALMKV